MSEAQNIARIVTEAASRDGASEVPDRPELLPDLSVDLKDSRLEFQLDCLQQELKHLNDNHTLRLTYTSRIYWLVVGWLLCVVVCVGMTGLHKWGFSLTDAVLIAFITSTTVNVVGLFVLVAKWMYPANGNHGSVKSLDARAAEIRAKGSE